MALLAPAAFFWFGVAAIAEGMPGWLRAVTLVVVVAALAAVATRRWRLLLALALLDAMVVLVAGVLTLAHGIGAVLSVVALGMVVGALPVLAALALRRATLGDRSQP